ncbi:MAG: hypothetical protein WDN69_24815 [Aliidongia sp.]
MVIGDFYDALVEKYGEAAVRKQSRSVNVDFGVVIDAEGQYRLPDCECRCGAGLRRG